MNKELYEENIKVLQRIEKEGFTAEIIEFNKLRGATNLSLGNDLFFARESGMTLKQVRIRLSNSAIQMEAGALYYLKGNIQIESKIGGFSGLVGKMVKGSLNSESTFKPIYKGTGEIVLEPTFGHFLMINLEDETIIVDKGLYYASEPTLKIDVAMQSNISAGLLGGEGIFQTKISGTGLVILQIPIPSEEIQIMELENEVLQVDGNFALLRTENIEFSVKKSTNSLMGSITSGEGLLQTFEGTGQVWIAPTQPVYKKMARYGIEGLNNSKNVGNYS